ncbi:hypothetical protein C8F01DRAFT_437329 [Mycena amicta]|nr:hypothetical protein C8F01DRAFT_437329 [Mycena amicta]
MPSFLSKVFGRSKKEEKDTRQRPSSDASLLEGKFEAVPPVLTPTTPSFNGNAPSKDLSKQRSAVDGKDLGWHLSLNLPSPKEQTSKALGAVFEADPDAQILLSDAAIAERRLNPLEAFLLVQACSQSITAHGLETLGIMIPHYYSASPATQRKLISMFIHSLALNSPITTLSPSASSPVSDFESEVNSTRSPHDVAAVLRWGVRHLQLDNSCFGKDELWYKTFHDAEKASEYPPKAFTEKLVPLLPPSHLHLLTALLDIFSSLAAHAEANGISGSKLTRMLGYWMVSAPRVIDGDDYPSFYARWDKWGRIVEHLFLSRIRDETVDHRMPTRLTELVKQYPYAKSPSPTADSAFLPTPRFSTRKLEALYVRIDTEILSTGVKKPKNHALRLIADALKSTSSVDGVEAAFWESLRKHVSVADAESESYPGLSSLFADETIRFLSLLPMASDNDTKPAAPPPFSLVIPANKVARRRSMSMGDKDKAAAAAAVAHAKAASASSTTASSSGVPASESTEPIAIDWAQFSTSGFFSDENGQRTSKIAQTLLDNKDVEITLPRVPSSVRRKLPPPLIPLPSSRGRSLDIPAPKDAEEVSKQGASKATRLEIVQIDEAFADFWADALLDPISADWPSFVLCKVKSSIPAEFNGKRVQWLIIEQRFVAPPPPPQSPTATLEKELRPRPNSPKPSFASDSKSTKKKRFSFFTSLSSSSISSSSTSKKKSGKNAKVGEMGEILQEEEEEPSPSSPTKPSAPFKVEVIPPATDDPQPVVDAAAIQIQPSVAAPPVAERPPTNVDIDADAPGVPEVTEKAAAVEEHISEPTNAPPLVPEVPEVGIVSPQPISQSHPSLIMHRPKPPSPTEMHPLYLRRLSLTSTRPTLPWMLNSRKKGPNKLK